MDAKSASAPKLSAAKTEAEDERLSASLRRGSLSARLTKSSDKGNALEQLAAAAEVIRRQRASESKSASRGHVRQRSLSTSEIPDAVKRGVMRAKAEQELRETEEAYVRDLEFVTKRLIEPLERREILTKEERLTLFANLPQILEMHRHLLDDLKKTDRPWEPYMKMSAFFKLYIAYSTAHAAAAALAPQVTRSNPAFGAFVEAALEANPSRLRLVDYLIKPVQRICKYPLLFNELQRHSDAPHCLAIGEVAKRMGEVAEFVNAAQRRVESAPRLLEIAQLLDTNGKSSFTELIAPDRHFVREALCEVLLDGGESEKLMVLLFNDMILLARPPSMLRKKYELRQEITLSAGLRVAQAAEGAKPSLAVLDNTRPLFTMRGLSADECKEWQRAIESTQQMRLNVGSPRQRRE